MATAATVFPHGGWDVHHHIFDRESFWTRRLFLAKNLVASTFSYASDRHLTPPPATIPHFLEFKSRIGATHSVLTHGLSYGSDCTSLLAFLQQLGKANTKGIGVIDPDTTTDATIASMHEAGVRGIRVNLYKYQAMHDLELQTHALREHARRIAAFPGWTMAFTHTHPEFWQDLRPVIESDVMGNGIRLVTDHFALLKAPSMLPPSCNGDVTQQPGWDAIMSLVRDGLLWIKLSAPYRVSEMQPEYHDLEPVVRALVQANPRRILWGSDWPHTPRMKVRTAEEAAQEVEYLDVDDAAWLRSLRTWLTDEQWDLMVRVNPAELYDW